MSPSRPVGSYPAFSPLPLAWRLFSVTLLCRRRQLPVRKYGTLCCPDFPLTAKRGGKRQDTVLFCVDKDSACCAKFKASSPKKANTADWVFRRRYPFFLSNLVDYASFFSASASKSLLNSSTETAFSSSVTASLTAANSLSSTDFSIKR